MVTTVSSGAGNLDIEEACGGGPVIDKNLLYDQEFGGPCR